MKNNNLLLVAVGIIIMQCSNTQTHSYFEGEIVYTLNYKSNIDEKDSIFGDTLRILIKDGYIKRVYNTYQIGGLEEEIYFPETGLIYTKTVGIDTIYWFDLKNMDGTKVKGFTVRKPNELILGKRCEVLDLDVAHYVDSNEYIIEYKYYFSDILLINPEWFENYQFGYTDQAFKKMGSFYLKYIMNTPAFSTIVEAVEINQKELDSSLFTIDKKLPIKEFIY